MTTAANPAHAARMLVDRARDVMDIALRRAAEITGGGELLDDHQVHGERIAYLATQVRAAADLVTFVERVAAAGAPDALHERMAFSYAAEVTHALRSQVEAAWRDFGLTEGDIAPLHAADAREAVRAGMDGAFLRAIGRDVIATGGVNHINLEDDVATLTRDMAREFAKNEVAPYAQEIHRQDLTVPE
ncbi:MAG: hypothetical protein O2822_03000, partial [Chloroflexi bacterium]|nr:hypothetical protein [Chloroflexota bacterium]